MAFRVMAWPWPESNFEIDLLKLPRVLFDGAPTGGTPWCPDFSSNGFRQEVIREKNNNKMTDFHSTTSEKINHWQRIRWRILGMLILGFFFRIWSCCNSSQFIAHFLKQNPNGNIWHVCIPTYWHKRKICTNWKDIFAVLPFFFRLCMVSWAQSA